MKGKQRYTKESFRLYLPPAVGYNFPLLLRLLAKNGVDPRYYSRAVVISLISMIGVPFRIYEKLAYDKKTDRAASDEPPLFILGHWRSGTTHLHNLLCKDPNASYVTTYQSVFPDCTLNAGGRFLFKNFMNLLIPFNRKGDNVELGADYPQEEEFALAARTPASYYLFWFFPELMMQYYDEFLTFEASNHGLREKFMKDYHRVINKAQLYSGKNTFLSKNPVNTGRIPMLLEMFPEARFVHIYRNPVEVILSTRHFFEKMMPGLTLHKIDMEKVYQDIYRVYELLMHRYFDTRSLIPERNLIEIRYEDLVMNSQKEIEKIYSFFKMDGYEKAQPIIEAYAESKQAYVRNKYSIPSSLLDEILEHTDFTMKKWNYHVPDNLEIIK